MTRSDLAVIVFVLIAFGCTGSNYSPEDGYKQLESDEVSLTNVTLGGQPMASVEAGHREEAAKYVFAGGSRPSCEFQVQANEEDDLFDRGGRFTVLIRPADLAPDGKSPEIFKQTTMNPLTVECDEQDCKVAGDVLMPTEAGLYFLVMTFFPPQQGWEKVTGQPVFQAFVTVAESASE